MLRTAFSTLSRRGLACRYLASAPRSFYAATAHQASAAAPEAEQAPLPETDSFGWGSTTVGEILKAKAEESGAWLWCSKDDLVIDAVRKMTHANVGSLLVFDPSKVNLTPESSPGDASEAVAGIITERDYMTKVVVKGKSSSATKVAEIMTPAQQLMTVTPKHSVLDVMTLMVDKNFRHVPVLEAGSMAGMVSIRDVVHVMLKEHREEVGRLREYIEGTF